MNRVCGLVALLSVVSLQAVGNEPSWIFTNQAGTHLIAGNPNGDGRGEVHVYHESSANPVLTLRSPRKRDLFGVTNASAGDLDGDGLDDIIVGAPFAGKGNVNHGAIHVFSSATGLQIMQAEGESTRSYLGRAVAGAGDIDGDGVPDLIASGWIHSDQDIPYGRVYVLSGANGNVLRTITSFEADDGFGYTVTSLGDLTGDGVPEIAISAPMAQTNTLGQGAVYIFDLANQPSMHMTSYQAMDTFLNDSISRDFFGSVIVYDDLASTGQFDAILVGSVDPISYGNTTAQFLFSRYKVGTGETLGTIGVPSQVSGDAIPDGKVSTVDAEAVNSAINAGGGSTNTDLNADGQVTVSDVSVVLAYLGNLSPVQGLISDPSPIVSRFADLTNGTGSINVVPGGSEPWQEPIDCNDDNDDDDTDDNDDDDADDNDDGGGSVQPPYPGGRPRPGDGDHRASMNAPSDDSSDDDCDDDDDDDDDGDGCGVCDAPDDVTDPDCNAVDRIEHPNYVGMGTDFEVTVFLASTDWGGTLAATGTSADLINSVSPSGGTATARKFNVNLKDQETGTVQLKFTAVSTEGVLVTECFSIEVVEYATMPFMHAAFIPCEVVEGPPGSFDWVGGDDRVFCTFQVALPEFVYGGTPVTHRTKFKAEVPCNGPIVSIPTCVTELTAGEYQLGAYASIVQPAFGVSTGYNDIAGPGPVEPETCATLVPRACDLDKLPGFDPDDQESQSAAFDWDNDGCSGDVLPETNLWPAPNFGRANHAILFRVAPNKMLMRFRLAGRLPLFFASPNIDVRSTAEIVWHIDEDSGQQSATIFMVADHDGFPAHEWYAGPIENGAGHKRFDPLPLGNTPFHLFGDGIGEERTYLTYTVDLQ